MVIHANPKATDIIVNAMECAVCLDLPRKPRDDQRGNQTGKDAADECQNDGEYFHRSYRLTTLRGGAASRKALGQQSKGFSHVRC